MSLSHPFRLAAVALLCLLVSPLYVPLSAQQAPASPEAWVARGDRLLDDGDTQEAQEAYREALKVGADVPEAYLGLARAAVAGQDWSGAANHLDAFLEHDPTSLEAHYYRGIAHRELAKFRTINQNHHWNEAERSFEWVIEQDSLFEDVLLQLALLRRYHEAYDEALELGERQLRLKPELEEARRELYSLYGHYLNHTDAEEALAWLRARPSDFAAFFAAEQLRRMGRLEEADAAFEHLQASGAHLAPQPVLLARARIRYAQDDPEGAEYLLEEAVERIQEPLEADLVFDDFKYVFNEEELARYRTLRTPEEYRTFFEAFWVARDPLPASPYNLRLEEHYRRLLKAEEEYAYDGFRLWQNDPDRLGELDFPDAYRINGAFNDKGLIYIRHGEPDDRISSVGGDVDFRTHKGAGDIYWTPDEHSPRAGWLPNESWRYYDPKMDFHFVLPEGGGDNGWRLTPELTGFDVLEDLEHWGPPYSEMVAAARALQAVQQNKMTDPAQRTASSGDEAVQQEVARMNDTTDADPYVTSNLLSQHQYGVQEFETSRRRLVEKSREAVTRGLTTDRHTWAEEVVPIEMPYQLVAFRGEDGKTQVEIHFALPIGHITQELGADAGTTDIELGYAFHDPVWQEVAKEVETKRLPTSPDEAAALIDFFELSVPPDSYRVSIHSRPTRTDQLGGHTFSYRVPDFSERELDLSDLLLANDIAPARGGSRYDRGDLHVTPNPFGRFPVTQSVFVYYEVYNLTLGADDRARFTTEYVLVPEEPKRKLLGLFRSDRPAVSLRVERTAGTTSPVEAAEVDVSEVDPGWYTLTVRVTDGRTGAVRERSRRIELVPPFTSPGR